MKAKIAIEINGGEHFGLKFREHNDKEKIDACKKKKIKLLVIDNSFVKSYEYIRDLLMCSKNKKASQISIDDVLALE